MAKAGLKTFTITIIVVGSTGPNRDCNPLPLGDVRTGKRAPFQKQTLAERNQGALSPLCRPRHRARVKWFWLSLQRESGLKHRHTHSCPWVAYPGWHLQNQEVSLCKWSWSCSSIAPRLFCGCWWCSESHWLVPGLLSPPQSWLSHPLPKPPEHLPRYSPAPSTSHGLSPQSGHRRTARWHRQMEPLSYWDRLRKYKGLISIGKEEQKTPWIPWAMKDTTVMGVTED